MITVLPSLQSASRKVSSNLANGNFADLFKLAVTPFGHDQSEHKVLRDLLSLSNPSE